MSGFTDPYRMLMGWWSIGRRDRRGPFVWDELDAFAPGMQEGDSFAPGLEESGDFVPGFVEHDQYTGSV